MMNWELLQSFLAVARYGSPSAAAHVLQLSPTTIERQIASLHRQAGAQLLQKTVEGYVLTSAGERVFANVQRIEAEVLSAERVIIAEDEQVAGEVRVTTVESFGAKIVIPLLQTLAERQPGLEVELIADVRPLSLPRREADIAVRLAEFEQHEVDVSHVADMAFGLYASRTYIDRHGMPDFEDGCADHVLVALQQDLALVPDAKRLAQIAPNATIALRSNSRDVQVQAVRTGYGFGFLACYLAAGLEDLVELKSPGGRLVRGIWIGVHRDMRQVPSIRFVFDHLFEGLRSSSARLVPPAPD